jgi:glycosyltransferase involved in cell wall biosynthesis
MNAKAPTSELHDLASTTRIGLVAIGRNEGTRLRACLESARNAGLVMVYVDSGSTDGSGELARSLGAIVVDLDLSKPFTAARARNEGFAALLAQHPDLTYVQFVDGDCQLQPDWIATARAFLDTHPDYAVACGRRRERFPDATIYNQLCDLEWNTPVGDALSCGGDALIRVTAFQAVGGYNPTVIAGEEPEMCVRLRALGNRIRRLDAEMTLHDAAMTRFGQWWKRNVRAGHAFAEGFHRHGQPPERMWRKSVRSNYFWTILFPFWPLLWLKVLRQGRGPLYATFITLSKLPQTIGQLKFHYNRLTGKHQKIIEYK